MKMLDLALIVMTISVLINITTNGISSQFNQTLFISLFLTARFLDYAIAKIGKNK